MAKSVFKTKIDYILVPLEDINIKYRLLPSGETGKKKSNKIHIDIDEVTCSGRDVRWLFSQKALEQFVLEDYNRQTQGSKED